MIIKTYKELKEYVKDSNITVSTYSEDSIIVFINNKKYTLPMEVNNGKNN